MSSNDGLAGLVYVGTYTTRETFVSGRAEGIYAFRFDPATGALSPAHTSSAVVNPSYLAIHPSRRYLYSVNEVYSPEGATEPGGGVSSFAIDQESGALTFLNRQASHGGAPCHLVVDQSGKFVLVANYSTGSIALLPIQDDGSLASASDVVQHAGSSVNPQRQQGPHAHSINLDRANRFALVCDLGLDKILTYRLDAATAKLVPHDTPWAEARAGAGPRHLDVHPNGRYAYVINELDSTIDAFAYDAAAGTLRCVQSLSTLPEDFSGRSHCADVHVHPNGRFVYGSNRGHNSIAVFAIDAASGQLTAMGHTSTQGKTPRNFTLDPTGQFLLAANQDSDTIVTFRVDPERGTLTPAGPVTTAPTPVCIKFMPA